MREKEREIKEVEKIAKDLQKKAAEVVLTEKGLKVPVVAVVKNEHHRPREKLSPEILLANSEAHRFALRFQKNVRYNVG